MTRRSRYQLDRSIFQRSRVLSSGKQHVSGAQREGHASHPLRASFVDADKAVNVFFSRSPSQTHPRCYLAQVGRSQTVGLAVLPKITPREKSVFLSLFFFTRSECDLLLKVP